MKIFSNVAVALAATVIFPAAGIAAAGTTAGSAATPTVVRNAVIFYAVDPQRRRCGRSIGGRCDARHDIRGDRHQWRRAGDPAGGWRRASAGQGWGQGQGDRKVATKRQDLLVNLDLAKPEGVPKDEFVGRNAAIFTKADTNQDGKIDRTEFVVLLDGFGGVLP